MKYQSCFTTGKFARVAFNVVSRAIVLSFAVFLGCATATTSNVSSVTSVSASKDFNLQLKGVPATEGTAFLVFVESKKKLEIHEVEFEGRLLELIPVSDSRYVSLVGVEYGITPGKKKLTIKTRAESSEKVIETTDEVEVLAGTFPSEKLSVPPRTVEPSAKDRIQIKKDQKVLGAVYTNKTKEKFWGPGVQLPIQSDVTSIYGTSRNYNGKKINPHLGTDLRAKVGTSIGAPMPARVALASFLFFTGNTVILDHGFGFFSIYAHMSKLSVKAGQKIKAGQQLGLAGATGRVTGPHLHWGINLNGTRIDPLSVMKLINTYGI